MARDPWILVAAVILAFGTFAPALGQRFNTAPATNPSVLLSADEVTYDQELGIAVARGHVEISQGERILLADTVTYNQITRQVAAVGNISLLEPGGNVIFADYFDLTDDLRDGVAQNIRILLSDQSRFAAAGGARSRGNRTELRQAVYSPCALCNDDPTRPPLWQVKAARVVHDQVAQEVTYTDASLEFFGIPIAYTPYFEHADPTASKKSGFLVPEIGNSSRLGAILKTPYFFNIAPNRDATLEPIFTSKEGVVLSGEYRERLVNGEFQVSGSITRTDRRDSLGNRTNDDDDRGHIFSKGRIDLNDRWRGGYDLERATDDTYLRRYGFRSPNTLRSRAFAEGFNGRQYTSVDAYAFQGLRAEDDPGTTPLVLPMFNYNFVGEPGRLGSRYTLDANALSIYRSEGTNMRRLSLKGGWQLPYTAPAGDVYTLSTVVQSDAYDVSEVLNFAAPNTATRNGFAGRVIPQIGLDWRYPLVRHEGAIHQLIEPRLGLVMAPNGGNPPKIPNEDSQSLEVDDTNLFSLNRFSGLDRVDGSQRVNYGLNLGAFGDGGGVTSLFIGQSYRLNADDTFPNGSGLEDNLSDFSARLRITPNRYLDLLYRVRIDKDDFVARRSELAAEAGPPLLRLSANYVFFDRSSASGQFGDREEVNARLSSRFTENWEASIRTRQDITENGGTLLSGVGINYEDECFYIALNVDRRFTIDRDLRPDNIALLRVVFKTLGDVKTRVF